MSDKAVRAFLRVWNGKKFEERAVLDGEDSLYLRLSDGGELEIELFERVPGRISIRSTGNGPSQSLAIYPRAANVADVSAVRS